MDEYRFNSGSDLQIGRALEEINSMYYQGMGDFDIRRCQMWFNDNTACCQVYIVRLMYDLIKCDVYRFVVKTDGSGKIDYIEFAPEFNEKANSTTIRIAGRIIYIDVKLNGETTRDEAKNISGASLGQLPDNIKNYYDIQFIIENDTNTAEFPIIGYKHHTKTAISWTKNR